MRYNKTCNARAPGTKSFTRHIYRHLVLQVHNDTSSKRTISRLLKFPFIRVVPLFCLSGGLLVTKSPKCVL